MTTYEALSRGKTKLLMGMKMNSSKALNKNHKGVFNNRWTYNKLKYKHELRHNSVGQFSVPKSGKGGYPDGLRITADLYAKRLRRNLINVNEGWSGEGLENLNAIAKESLNAFYSYWGTYGVRVDVKAPTNPRVILMNPGSFAISESKAYSTLDLNYPKFAVSLIKRLEDKIVSRKFPLYLLEGELSTKIYSLRNVSAYAAAPTNKDVFTPPDAAGHRPNVPPEGNGNLNFTKVEAARVLSETLYSHYLPSNLKLSDGSLGLPSMESDDEFRVQL